MHRVAGELLGPGLDWRWPTTAEPQHMLSQGGASHETGMMVFTWKWTDPPPGGRLTLGSTRTRRQALCRVPFRLVAYR